MTQSRLGGMKEVTLYVFSKFFDNDGRAPLCYLPARNSRRGYYFPSLDKVQGIEPVFDDKKDEFSSFDRFKSKFDSRFITDAEVQKLWDGTSCQHGGKYRPSDFRRLGTEGKRVMARFLARFKNVNEPTPSYMKRDDHLTLEEYYNSNGRPSSNFGRDIKISHQTNLEWVCYSSEYPGCGNGRYGLIANEHEFLWLEDD
jgi:hypothetical protein